MGDNLLNVDDAEEETSIFEKSNVKIFGVVFSSSSLLFSLSPFNFSTRPSGFVSEVVWTDSEIFLSFFDEAKWERNLFSKT